MKPTRETELGIEQFCSQCPDGGEWWPLTEEFWYFQQGKPNGPCIACQAESRSKHAGEPCCVPGCTRPRHATKSRVGSRCLEHRREYELIRTQLRRTSMAVQP